MFRALNKNITVFKNKDYGKSNDVFISKEGISIIDCSLGTSPFSSNNNIHKGFNIEKLKSLYEYTGKGSYDVMKQSIVHYFGNNDLKIENIHLGHGGLVLLERLATKFFKPSSIIGIGPQFPYFINDHILVGGKYSSVEILDVENQTIDYSLDGLFRTIGDGAYDICYIDNPNNPTGYCFDLNAIERIVSLCQDKDIICIIDEAYGSFISPEKSSLHLVKKYSNLITLRSYSKGFGLSGARAAYLIMGDELSAIYSKVDNGFEPSAISLHMCIEASFHDSFMIQSRNDVESIKNEFIPKLKEKGFLIYPNDKNVSIFLMQKTGVNLHSYLQARSILCTPGSGFTSTSNIIDETFVRVLVPKSKQMMNEFLARL